MEKRLTLVVAVVALALLASGGSAKAALLLNGDFEQPVQGNGPSQFLPLGTVIPGWKVVGTGGVNVDQTFSPMSQNCQNHVPFPMSLL